MSDLLVVEGYELAADRAYHPVTHVWVETVAAGRVRLGLDPLGVETTGSLAQVALVEVDTRVLAGEPVGSIEAEKFVGPFTTPVAGTVTAVNAAVVANPRVVHTDPLGAWFVELALAEGDDAPDELVVGAEAITTWFAARLRAYREQGVLAE